MKITGEVDSKYNSWSNQSLEQDNAGLVLSACPVPLPLLYRMKSFILWEKVNVGSFSLLGTHSFFWEWWCCSFLFGNITPSPITFSLCRWDGCVDYILSSQCRPLTKAGLSEARKGFPFFNPLNQLYWSGFLDMGFMTREVKIVLYPFPTIIENDIISQIFTMPSLEKWVPSALSKSIIQASGHFLDPGALSLREEQLYVFLIKWNWEWGLSF